MPAFMLVFRRMIPEIDVKDFPVVRFKFGESMTLAEVDAHGARAEALFNERGPFISLSDLSATDFSKNPSTVRKRIAEVADHLAQKKAFIAEYVIVPSALVRALFTAYTWIRTKKNHPLEAFANAALAQKAADQILHKRATAA